MTVKHVSFIMCQYPDVNVSAHKVLIIIIHIYLIIHNEYIIIYLL